MAATKRFYCLMPFTDQYGLHSVGQPVDLPYKTFAQKSDADRLVDYGVVAETAPAEKG